MLIRLIKQIVCLPLRAGESDELKSLLRNPHLRNYLTHMNTTHNPAGFVRIAMQEPLFVEFADACMKVLHPDEDAAGKPLTDEQITEMVREGIEQAADEN